MLGMGRSWQAHAGPGARIGSEEMRRRRSEEEEEGAPGGGRGRRGDGATGGGGGSASVLAVLVLGRAALHCSPWVGQFERPRRRVVGQWPGRLLSRSPLSLRCAVQPSSICGSGAHVSRVRSAFAGGEGRRAGAPLRRAELIHIITEQTERAICRVLTLTAAATASARQGGCKVEESTEDCAGGNYRHSHSVLRIIHTLRKEHSVLLCGGRITAYKHGVRRIRAQIGAESRPGGQARAFIPVFRASAAAVQCSASSRLFPSLAPARCRWLAVVYLPRRRVQYKIIPARWRIKLCYPRPRATSAAATGRFMPGEAR